MRAPIDSSVAPRGGKPDDAKALLQQAGVTSPVPVAITVTNSPAMVRIAQILQAQAGAAGFKVEVRQIDATSLITVLRQRDFDLCMAPWSGRYDPDGKVERVVKLPVPNPTSCVFGGPNLTDLYVTSAWLLLSEAERQAARAEGDEDLLGGVRHRRHGVAGEHRQRQLLRQQRVAERIAAQRPADEDPLRDVEETHGSAA